MRRWPNKENRRLIVRTLVPRSILWFALVTVAAALSGCGLRGVGGSGDDCPRFGPGDVIGPSHPSIPPHCRPSPQPHGIATGAVRGPVGEMISAGEIEFVPADPQPIAHTFANGRYRLGLKPGDYRLTISAQGYFAATKPVSIAEGETTQTDFVLKRNRKEPTWPQHRLHPGKHYWALYYEIVKAGSDDAVGGPGAQFPSLRSLHCDQGAARALRITEPRRYRSVAYYFLDRLSARLEEGRTKPSFETHVVRIQARGGKKCPLRGEVG